MPDNLVKYEDVTVPYTGTVLRESEGVEIAVCYEAFLSIFGITKGKLKFIEKSLKRTGLAPKDKTVITSCSQNVLILNAIVNHIKSFKSLCTPSTLC